MVRKKKKAISHDTKPSHGSVSPLDPPAVNFKVYVASVPRNELLCNVSEPFVDVSEWYEQLTACPSVYAQLNCIQSLRAKCIQIQQKHSVFTIDTLQCFRTLSRLLFRLFSAMYDSNDRLRKSLLTALYTIFKLFPEPPNLHTVLCNEMELYINEIASNVCTQSNSTFLRLEILRLMLESQFLMSSFVLRCACDSLQRVLRYLTTQLERCCQNNTLKAVVSHTNAMALENAQLVVKCLLLLCSKNTLWKRLNSLKKDDSILSNRDGIWQQMYTLMRHCCVLLQHKGMPKDVLTQVALCGISLYRNWIEMNPLMQCVTLETRKNFIFRQTLCSIDLFALDTSTDSVCVVCSHHICQCKEIFSAQISSQQDNVYVRLAVYRAVITCSGNEELCGHFKSTNSAICVLEDLLLQIHSICMTEAFLVRLYGIQVLEIALRRLRDNYQSTGNACTSTATLRKIFALVLSHWDHPSKKMYHFMPSLFSHLLQLQIEWMPIVSEILELRSNRRAKYAMISILLKEKRVDVLSVWKQNQEFVSDIVGAIASDETYAMASESLVELLKAIDTEKECFQNQLIVAIHKAIGSNDFRFRRRLVSYTFPLLFGVDASLLFTLARAVGSDWKQSSAHLWALLHITKYARKRFTRQQLHENHFEALDEIAVGLRHASADIRGAAFDALSASLKSTIMPSEAELNLLKSFLSQSSHEIAPSDRMNALIGLKSIFLRIREAVRLTEKSCHMDQKQVALAVAFQKWLCRYIIDSIAVGSVPTRTIMGLQVLLLCFEMFPSTSLSLKPLVSAHILLNLLHLLSSSWDIIRSLSCKCLESIPFDSEVWHADTWRALMHWGLQLIACARQRECDAGALILCFVYKRGRTSASIIKVIENEMNSNALEMETSDFVLRPIEMLTESLARNTRTWRNVMEHQTSVRFLHGHLLTLRYYLEIIDTQKVIAHPKLMQKLLNCVHKSIQFSKSVISDTENDTVSDMLSVVGPITATVADISEEGGPTLRVDCRGHLIVTEDEDGLQERIVVGSWLAVREGSALLRVLMERFPLSHSLGAVWSFKDVRFSGHLLMRILLQLKHQGAIASVFVNFEGICRRFSLSNERIAQLLSQWIEFLLEKLCDATQNFILRRSSGFAYCFLAILRAEPRNRDAKLFARVVEQLLRVASRRDASKCTIRSKIHALNVLKLICQDAVLADDTRAYIVPIFHVAIEGFGVAIWAVRNSSMMLYTAITQRAIGDKRIADGARDERIVCSTLFLGCPGFRQFLYERFASGDGDDDGDGDEAKSSSIYFILMVLSRLKPKEDDEIRGAMHYTDNNVVDTSLQCFVPHIIRCGRLKSAAVRQMAARALAAIVSEDCVNGILCQLAQSLGNGKQFNANEMAAHSARHNAPFQLQGNNTIHGVLLQIEHLLARMSTPSNDCTEANKRENTAIIVTVFESVISYWKDSILCVSIVAQALKVLHRVLVMSHWDDHSTKNEILSQVRVKCHDQLYQLCTNVPRQRPGSYERNQTLVRLYFTTHSHPFPFLDTLLQSHYLEIRNTAMRCVQKAISRQPSKDFLNQLLTLFPSLWEYETQPQCRVRLLEIGYQCCKRRTDGEIDQQSRFLAHQMGLKVYNVMKSSRNVDIQCASLRLLAVWCRAQQALTTSTLSLPLEHWTRFSRQILDWADTSSPVCVRQAASKALRLCGLLSCWTFSKEAATHCWIAAISLLQADDPNTRNYARQAIQQVFHDHFHHLHAPNLSESHLLSHIMTLLVDALSIHSDFESVAESCLEELLFSLCDNLPHAISSCELQSDQSDTSPVFRAEKGIDVQDFELVMQHYLSAASSLSYRVPQNVRQRMYGAFIATVEALVLDANVHNSIQHNVLYNKRIFPRLYALLRIVQMCCVKERKVDSAVETAAEALYSMLVLSNTAAIHPGFLTELKVLCHETSGVAGKVSKVSVREHTSHITQMSASVNA